MFAIDKLVNIISEKQHSTEWFNRRNNMLTASDFAAALGHNKYCSQERLFRLKTGLIVQANNKFMQHGTDNEAAAREKYEKITGEKVVEFGCISHAQVDWRTDRPLYSELGGSPDGVTHTGRLIEIKCPYTREIEDEVPTLYVDQIQGLMWILDLQTCDFVQYKPEKMWRNEQFVITSVKRDPDWAKNNVPKLLEFWKRVRAYKTSRSDVVIKCRHLVTSILSKSILAHFYDMNLDIDDEIRNYKSALEKEQSTVKSYKPKKRKSHVTKPKCLILSDDE